MKVLLLYDYPPSPSGLATQGDLLYRGLLELGIDARAAHFESPQEKEWYYRWFRPDIVIGTGYWGHTPNLVLHPLRHEMLPVPWLVANGYIANHQDVLNNLPLILVTSNWVKQMYVRDGIKADNIVVLPIGCDTETFTPRDKNNPRIHAVRQMLNIHQDELMILTVGGDAASKGGREVMQALALLKKDIPEWKYVCKVWPQERTRIQNAADLELARDLGIAQNVIFTTDIISRNFVPYLLGACDIYAAPSRLEGFGMLQVEAGACEKPVIGIRAMGMLDTLIHGETALLARVAEKIVVNEVSIPDESESTGYKKILFDEPRTVDYRANVHDIAEYLHQLITQPLLRLELGQAARKRVVENFNYRKVAEQFVKIINDKLGIV
ncbi:glycosyltransferase family 4 protein [Pedobacter cryoconitis]|uniref:Glycosyltransferase involved in cell wall biosynthesis n=1 Tax=Pedobacter cryoconitis TaxID=188932 RepID=A0A7X0IZE1_9SPHI|nr:glycosyltransferase family 4 protein [Pedobacter cryoconitis]MBB6498208.1 glycosyltransferase involved in cell wall biosynthesis [Pedobacter cryoconitis]